MFAIVQAGSRQYRVEAGSEIAIEKIAGLAGERVELDRILLAEESGESGGTGVSLVGTPFIAGAKVEAVIVRQGRLRKIFLLKKKRRKHYRRRGGHRQELTWLRVEKISIEKGEV